MPQTSEATKNNIKKGLNGSTAVGRCGSFDFGDHKEIGNTTIGLNTCFANALSLFAFGKQTRLIGAPTTGWNVSTEVIDQSWTGMGLKCSSNNSQNIRIDYRTTVPGALYEIDGKTFGWDWAVSSSPATITLLPSNKSIENKTDILNCGKVFCANTSVGPVLFSCSQPIQKLESISWEHWRFHFAQPNAKIMITPLLTKDDIPKNEEEVNIWANLTENPPLYCSESYEKTKDAIVIYSNFSGASGTETTFSPLPTSSLTAKNSNQLEKLPAHKILLQTVFGPYALAENTKGSYKRTIDTKWVNASIKPTKETNLKSEKLPFELAYAGDSSWDENSTMDKLLSWRVWGQVYSVLSDDLKTELKKRVPLPTKNDFDNSILIKTEPVSGRKWAMDKTIFSAKDEISKASFDVDWYNGLTLSGLARAGNCSDPEIQKEAKELAKSIKESRSHMVAYYSIFNDWTLGVAWTDARGELLNFDCAHNGLEGILAERQFCLWEGDQDGANFMEYLAAKTAPIFVADSFPFGTEKRNENVYGPSHLNEWRHGSDSGLSNKAPYNLAGDFPEFSALLKTHGPIDQLKQQALDYEIQKLKYEDWLSYYIGKDHAEYLRSGKHLVEKFGVEGKQEAREQAPIFYLVSPIISLRLLILDEPAAKIVESFKTELPLLTKIYCQAEMKLIV